jgi:predicted transcriptional regulator
VIDADKASEIEAQLAELLGVTAGSLRDYLNGNVRAGGARRMGYRFVRGTQGAARRRRDERAWAARSGEVVTYFDPSRVQKPAT